MDHLYEIDLHGRRVGPHPGGPCLNNPYFRNLIAGAVEDSIRSYDVDGLQRGSERQGGQNEMTDSPATWPVPAVCTLVVDGKEANIVNLWHSKDVNAGDDLVLRWLGSHLATPAPGPSIRTSAEALVRGLPADPAAADRRAG